MNEAVPGEAPHPRSPALSAVVLVGRLRERAGGALRSLLAQELDGGMEILVYDFADGDARPIPGSDAPSVRVLRAAPGATFAQVRLRALDDARSPIVAYVEEHVRVLPGWARALVEAHRRENVAAVGAVVGEANPGRGKSSVIGAMSYGLWYLPTSGGDAEILPGHNCSYKRDVLFGLGSDLHRLFESDIQLQKRLRRDGHRLWLEPAAQILHLNEGTWRSIARGIYLWHRSYGPLRAWDEGWSLGRRCLYILATPLLPAYFLWHFPRRLARSRPDLARTIRRNAFGVWFVQLAAAWGQALGLVVGPGRSPEAFTDYELHEPRPY